MNQFAMQLAEIMHKIAFKVPWQKLKLNEEELNVLDLATGEQMVDIAYKNRIPFTRFIHHADELIDEFNEHKFRQYIKDVKELKNALETPFKCKDAQEIQIEPIETDPFARERELMQAAINEVLQGRYTDEYVIGEVESNPNMIGNFIGRLVDGQGQNQFNIEQENQAPSKTREFVKSLRPIDDLGSSISIQRYEQSRFADSVSLIESRFRDDPFKSNFGEDFPEPQLKELASLGHFDGPEGLKIFNNIVDRDQEEIRRTGELPMDESARAENIQIASIPDIELPLENFDITPQIETLPPSIDPSVVVNRSNIPDIEHPVIQRHTPRSTNSDQSYAERLARFERASSVSIDQPALQKGQKPKRRLRVRRDKKLFGNEQVINLIKPLSIKLNKIFKIRKNPNRVAVSGKNLDIDMFSLLENLVEYDLPANEDVEEMLFISNVPEPQYISPNEPPVIPMDIELPQLEQKQLDNSVNKRAINSPQLENVSKRPRIALEASIEIPLLEPSLPNQETSVPLIDAFIHPQEQVMQQPPHEEFINLPVVESTLPENLLAVEPQIDMIIREPQENSISINLEPENILVNPSVSNQTDSLFKTPLALPMKQTTAIIASFDKFRKKLNLKNVDESRTITQKDIIYGRLKNISREADITTTNQSTIPDINMPEAPQIQVSSSSVAPDGYREFKKKGVECIQFKNKQGNIVQYEEYNLQNMLLYLQVRKYMNTKSTSKLNLQLIFRDNVLKLKQPVSNHVMMIRLWNLCSRGYFIGKYSNDDTQLLQIELPAKNNLSDKENIP